MMHGTCNYPLTFTVHSGGLPEAPWPPHLLHWGEQLNLAGLQRASIFTSSAVYQPPKQQSKSQLCRLVEASQFLESNSAMHPENPQLKHELPSLPPKLSELT
jgi:hypothetical protein|tara:strand:+ start:75 stop:380 length:306 start_codon:yes stop_codon:yes gene_type:complete